MDNSSWFIARVNYLKGLASLSAILLYTITVNAQSSAFKGLENLFETPGNYVVYHVDHPPVIDGNINELVWQQVNWTKEFVDIEGSAKPKPTYPTKIKMLWDDSCLYIAAQLTEPNVWATLKHHDDVIFHDNDFEFFIDPANTAQPYYEVEVNPLNTIFDLLLTKPYRDGGSPLSNWDLRALRSAVKIQGTLNDPSDKDEGWTVEMAIPFKSLVSNLRSGTPHDGTMWRINFSRVEWDTKVVNGNYVKLKDSSGKALPEHNWVWSPQGVINMHYPERWGYLQFSNKTPNSVTFNLPYAELQKQYLWLIYYRQKKWFIGHHEYALTLHDLGIDEHAGIDKKDNILKLEATRHQFMAWITDSETKATWAINQDGLIQRINNQPHE
ncbi:carbohydrate-binding family 9-like protein [Mucilaginibacter sp. McL0603]|uniref:carbohydrate-binding family 9-like protein n=1 Tax=Mucilaginibacter sp. McL0603 TaxID=3415670 RepID=UPI003CF85464